MLKRFSSAAIFATAAFLLSSSAISAHVVVRPEEVGIGKFQTFSISVPNEKAIPTVGIRLVIPSGLKHVSPTVKTGWTIETKKDGENVTEIVWSGGSIPAERRDDFSFSAQTPAEATTLAWKAYQVYSDGTVVAWDQNPDEEEKHASESAEKTPYSQTKVVNDIAGSGIDQNDNLPLIFSGIAILLSVVSLGVAFRRRA